MTDRSKRPLWPWIVATVVAVPVLYVASFGPACWLNQRFKVGKNVIPLAYRPIFLAAADGRTLRAKGIRRYAELGAECGAMASFHDGRIEWATNILANCDCGK